MKKWLGSFLNKIRFNKSVRSDIYIDQIARDSKGKWVTDNESKLVYKNDDPVKIEKFTKAQEKRNADLEKSLIKPKCCGGDCSCSDFKKPTVSKKVEEVKVEAKRQQEKYGTPKPVAKKKPSGGGTKKELPLE